MIRKNLKNIESEKKGSFLWEVKGGTAKMYLKGTVHLVPKNFFPLKDEILKCFDECRNLVIEAILSEDHYNNLKITNDIIFDKDYIYEDGDSLYNHYPKEKIIKLRDYLISNKLCSQEVGKRFYKLKPDVVNALIKDGINKKINIDEDNMGIDNYFIMRANKMNKTILELESEEFQKNLLDKYYNKKSDDKKKNLKNSKEFNKGTPSILDIGWFFRFYILKMYPWIIGNTIKAASKLYGNDKEIIRQRKKLISQGNPLLCGRDEAMCEKLEKFLQTKDSYFVAVGSMHLLGEGSIVDRLQKKGYEVIRIF